MCLVMSSFSIVINLFIKLFPESLLKSEDKKKDTSEDD